MYMVSDLNPSALIKAAHDKLRQHLRSVCVCVCEKIIFLRRKQQSQTAFPFSVCVKSTTPHLLLWPVVLLYEFWFTESGVEAGIG